MKIDKEGLRRHYKTLSDEELLALDPAELTDLAQAVYGEELERRGLANGETAAEEEAGEEAPSFADLAEDDSDDADEAPDWLDDAACACAFSRYGDNDYAEQVATARRALRAAGIPCVLITQQAESMEGHDEYCVMVPGALALPATSVLDRDVFNARQEADWRAHLEALSDRELAALDPGVICAGLLDRVARLKRAYHEEAARRQNR